MRLYWLFLLPFFLALACTHEIGDSCTADVDCSPDMDRNCDRSQPGGYCLIIGCSPDECPNEAVCVEFTTPCPEGEGYDTDNSQPGDAGVDNCRLITPNRGRTYCLKHCRKNSDCRSKYQCTEPGKISAAIIDFDTKRSKICVPKSDTNTREDGGVDTESVDAGLADGGS